MVRQAKFQGRGGFGIPPPKKFRHRGILGILPANLENQEVNQDSGGGALTPVDPSQVGENLQKFTQTSS